MKKVLVCGWKGYIGFALTQRLLNQGFEVIGIDNNKGKNLLKSLVLFQQ